MTTIWHVRMTFEGNVEAPSSSQAVAEFKTNLGLPPASRRPEVSMTELSARLVSDVVEPTADPVAEATP